ncbi:MAG: YggS family pyridoxal phosphate-dependent enzyme [Oscillospiraceae bacterium]|nr:YggS family pyridoxal phosphate-dependent enzyme [Oscillospiraceae bacterium]
MTENLSTIDSLPENAKQIWERVAEAARQSGRRPEDIQVLAVTKTVPWERVNLAVEQGFSVLGENRVQEFLDKSPHYPPGCPIHFIGRLQTNKVKYIAGKVAMIQSVDSLRLAKEIDRQAEKHGRVMDILIEVNIGREESKGGVLPEDLDDFLQAVSVMRHLHVRGLMAIPPQNAHSGAENEYFLQMRKLFVDIRSKKIDNIDMDYLSMGMSGDFESAILCGANMVRIGSALFGGRK